MSLNSIFQYFVPKDKKFFILFEQASKNLENISEELLKIVSSHTESERIAINKEIERLEHVGDDITHQIMIELSKNFITPFDREDIHSLASALDDIADFIYESSNRIILYRVTDPNPHMIRLAELLVSACKDIHSGVTELRNLKNLRKITDSCVRINSHENAADDVFDRAVAELFNIETDAIKLIKYKEILSSLEEATDKCEDVANVMESILVKHA